MVTDTNEMEKRLDELTQELAKETNPKRRAQLMLERSVFANMFMYKKVE